MTSTTTSTATDIRPLDQSELSAVAGGALPIDMSQMPDRSIICGTIWILDQIFKGLGGGVGTRTVPR